MNFYCLRQSLSCPVDMLGRPDCGNCENYGDCSICGRANTKSCENCKDDREGNAES